MQTPFDDILISFRQTTLNIHQQNAQSGELFLFVYHFLKILRVLYSNMAEDSEKFQGFVNNLNQHLGRRMLTAEEMREKDDLPIQCRLGYMQFIDHLNRTGRVLKRMGFILPCYERIYFFRNKMVEHWDDYVQFLLDTDGLVSLNGQIAIPYASPGVTLADKERKSRQQQLAEEFGKLGVMLPSLEGKWYRAYADLMFTALEKIDTDLRKIPESIIKLLFKYSFPTPICDMEEYCRTLAAWLASLPLA